MYYRPPLLFFELVFLPPKWKINPKKQNQNRYLTLVGVLCDTLKRVLLTRSCFIKVSTLDQIFCLR
jgi:hypothetical protein